MSFQFDANNFLLVDIAAGGSGSNAAAGPTGSPVPADADYIGFNVGGNLVGVSAGNPLPITGSLSFSDPAEGVPGSTNPTDAIQVGGTDGTLLRTILTDTSGRTKVVGATPAGAAVTGNPVLIGGTDGTDLRSLLTDNLGSLIPASTGIAFGDGFGNTQQVWLSGQSGGATPVVIPYNFIFNGTTWDRLRSGTAIGSVLVNNGTAANLNATVVGTGTFAVQASITTLGQQLAAASVPVVLTAAQLSTLTPLSTVGVTQSTSPWVVSQSSAANLNATVTSAGGIFEVSPTTAANTNTNPFFTSITDGTTKATVIAATAALKTDLSSVAGTATVTVASGVQKVGIVGNANATLDQANGSAVPTNGLLVGGGSVAGGTNFTSLTVKAASTAAAATDTSLVVQPLVASHVMSTAAAGTQLVGVSGATGATLDAVITAATAPANALATLAVNNTTPPSLTTGQSVALQCDYEGSLFVKPVRRAQTIAKATTINATTTATTVLAAQGSGIFADISNLYITVAPAASTDISFTATLSDGTNSFIFDMDTGGLATSTADPTQINAHFNPPLPASSSATAWTVANSVSTGVVTHVTVVAVLQKAS